MHIISKDDADGQAGSPTFSADERTLYDHPSSDDEEYDDGRPSGELLEGDRDILESEDERERLLTTKQDGIAGLFNKKGVKVGKRDGKKAGSSKRERNMGGKDEGSDELMYEMEEGVGASNSSLSRDSSESDQRGLLVSTTHRKVCLILVIFCSI